MTSAVKASYNFQGLVKEAELGFECLLFPAELIEFPKITKKSAQTTQISCRLRLDDLVLNTLNNQTMYINTHNH